MFLESGFCLIKKTGTRFGIELGMREIRDAENNHRDYGIK